MKHLFSLLFLIVAQLSVTFGQTLKEAYGKNFLVGVALPQSYIEENSSSSDESKNTKCVNLICEQFNALSPENVLKPEIIHPTPDVWDFAPGDAYCKFASEHKMPALGHTLMWHNQTPDHFWLKPDGSVRTLDEMRHNLVSYIEKTVTHYAGKVYAWDVVNEIINEEGGYRSDKGWEKYYGAVRHGNLDSLVCLAFETAHRCDPNAELYYNDYNMWRQSKVDGVVRMVKMLKAKGLRIDGVGIQAHWGLDYPSMSDVEKTIDRLHALGVKVMITEFEIDVLPLSKEGQMTGKALYDPALQRPEFMHYLSPYTNGLPADIDQQLADRYKEIMSTIWKKRNMISRVTFWGIDDGMSWKNGFPIPNRVNYPLLFDRNLKPKKAFYSVLNIPGSTISMPQMFQDGMVLQRGKDVAVWGVAEANAKITVTWQKKKYTVTANDNGKWKVTLPKMKAGGPYVMEISDGTGNKKVIKDVLVGDVWMVSGQSNIDVHIQRVYPQYAHDIDQYSNDKIRLFRVQKNPQTSHQSDVLPDHWRHANKKEAWDFSAVGYFLAREMFKKTKGVPQGIICNSVGGSPVQAWIDIDSIKTFSPELYQKYQLYTDPEYVKEQDAANRRVGDLWNKMVNDNDPGLSGNWTSSDYDDSAWKTVNQYDNSSWALSNGKPVMGTVWLRQHITVDKAHAGKPAKLLVGRIYDLDHTYVNGKEVGVTWYQYPPRRYDIPEGLLREGDNVITVRIINKSGMPEFFPEKPYKIVFGDWSFAGTPEKEIPLSENWKTHLGATVTECLGGKTDYQNQASVLYNGMLCPVGPYTINGVVWYQGESNVGPGAEQYGPMLRMLMNNWRERLGNAKLPFVITQIANYLQPSEGPQNSYMAVIREQQRLTADADPMARVVTAIDLGETYDIHPLRKQDVAQRCAAALGNMVWGEKNVLSPQPVKVEAKGNEIFITMDQLMNAGSLHEFEVAGADRKYYNATATANGNVITVSSDKVNAPVSVRYAWKDNPIKADCKGKTGLPALPFEMK